jgi:AhpD family alkylhydroperoxidase
MEPRLSFQDVPAGWFELMQNIESYLKKSGISHQLLHLVKFRASQINGCGYCLDMHSKDAVKIGETPQRLFMLNAWKEAPVYSDAEKAALNLTDVLTKIHQADPEIIAEAYERAARHFTKVEIANIVMLINQINSWNRIAITFGTTPGTYKG